MNEYSKKVMDTTKKFANMNPDKIVWSRRWDSGMFFVMVIEPSNLDVIESKLVNKEGIAPPAEWEYWECIADTRDTLHNQCSKREDTKKVGTMDYSIDRFLEENVELANKVSLDIHLEDERFYDSEMFD